MVRPLLLFTTMFGLASPSNAGVKEDFIKEVVAQCGVSAAEAKGLATPGRTGTIVQFKICADAEVELDNGCVLECTRGGSKIGK